MCRLNALIVSALCFVCSFAVPVRALELTDCELIGDRGIGRVQASCATLQQPLDPEHPDGETIDVRIAVIRSLSPEPHPDAFTVINGGPGGSSISLYVQSAAVFEAIRRERDLVIIDQRGTGRSSPLDCPDLEDQIEDFDLELVNAATDQCLAELPHDPRYFTTSVAIQDLDAIRQALGYEQWNIYGVSYGTRVALHYARRFPDQVRSLIIDGVVPPQLVLGPNAALNSQQTLDRLLARCHSDPDCMSTFGSLPSKLTELFEQLKAERIAVSVPDPLSGRLDDVEIGWGHLAITLRMLSYAPETAALIPLLIDLAYSNDDYRPIASNALRIVSEMQGLIRTGMHNSVVCAEDIPFLGEVDWPALESTYLGIQQTQALEATCARWPAGVVDADMKEPLTSNVPTLILSGEEDPITPPAYGHLVAEGLPNSRHIVAPGQGHGVFSRGCIPGLITEFVETGTPAELDVSCVDRLQPMPFFLDTMGPAP
jgi:pimeloyl-ACP methyl ester carboxylesterase